MVSCVSIPHLTDWKLPEAIHLNVVNNTSLRALIVDDEALARRDLRQHLKSMDNIQLIGEAKNGREAIRKIRELSPDLVILDTQMPGMDGFDVIMELGDEEMPTILFVTAFDDFAIKAFTVSASNYLLKPIEAERLAEALAKVRKLSKRIHANAQKNMVLRLLSEITGESVKRITELKQKGIHPIKRKLARKLAIRDGGKTTWVKQADIEWIDAAGDYMCVHALGETHIMRKTMKELEIELDSDFLQRIHRSTIINVNHIKEMQSHINGEYFLTLNCGHIVKLSRTYKNKLPNFNR